MPEAELDILRRLYGAWNEGGVQAIKMFWDERVEWQDPPELPDARVYRGREVLAEHLEEWVRDIFEYVTFTIEIDRLLEVGDEVVAFLLVKGEGPEGVPYPRVPFIHVVKIDDGKVVRVRAFLDEAQALKAVGLKGGEVGAG